MWSASESPSPSVSQPSSDVVFSPHKKHQQGSAADPPADYHQDHRYDNMRMMGLPLNKMVLMDRPSLNLETAVAVRARTRTHETQRTDSDHSASDEEGEIYEQEFDVDESSNVDDSDGVEMKPLSVVLSSRDQPQIMENNHSTQYQQQRHDNHEYNKNLFSRILSPEMAQRLFRLTSSYGSSPTLDEQMVQPIHVQSSDEAEDSATASSEPVVEPLPQRKPPSFVKSPRPPSTPNTVVGSIGGAFTRIEPAHEGQSRQIKAVDARNLSITWDGHDQNQMDSQIHQPSVEEETNALLGKYNTLIKSMPQLSAIASATSAKHHMHGGKTGSVRAATETSASYTYEDSSAEDEEDGLSLTDEGIRAKKHQEATICCCPRSRLLYCIPSYFSHAPDSLKLVLLGSFVLMIMALIIFILGSIFLQMEENHTDESDHNPHESVISDEPSYVEAWDNWKSENSNRFLRGP